jgi:hypothetical protein
MLRVTGDRLLGLVQMFDRQEVRGKSQRQALRPVQPVPRERQILPHPSRQPRQVPAAANIREKTDRRFGHGQLGVLCRDTKTARLADPDAAAHRDAVHEGDGRLGIGEQAVVQPVFGEEERARRDPVRRTGVRQHTNIAPGTEAARQLGIAIGCWQVVDHHRFHVVILPPRIQGLQHALTHGSVECVQLTRAVQAYPADAALHLRDEFALHQIKPFERDRARHRARRVRLCAANRVRLPFIRAPDRGRRSSA